MVIVIKHDKGCGDGPHQGSGGEVKKNVTVNALIPVWFESDIGEQNKFAHDKLNEFYIPMGRFGNDDELKAALLFLVSPGSYVTGASIVVDGGISIQ